MRLTHTICVLTSIITLSFALESSDVMGYCGQPSPIPTPPSGYNLEQVQVFIRHGDRTRWSAPACWPSDKTIFNCTFAQLLENSAAPGTPQSISRIYRKTYTPNRQALPGNCALGQLTEKGFHQEQLNGKHLADAYSSIVQQLQQDPDTFFLRSDDSQRTTQSGQALFDTMLPMSDRKKWNAVNSFRGTPNTQQDSDTIRTINWNTCDSGYDTITPSANLCPAYEEIFTKASNSSAYTQHIQEVTLPLMKKIAGLLGVPVSQIDINQMFDCLYTHVCPGYPVPEVLQGDLFDAIVKDNTWVWQFLLSAPGAGKTTAGLLVKDALSALNTVVNPSAGTKPLRFALYAGHDTGPMMPLLAAFKVWDGIWTPYASLISWELYTSKSQEWFVRFTYNGKVMHVPGCSAELCALHEFLAVAQALVPTAADCDLSTTDRLNMVRQKLEIAKERGFLSHVYYDHSANTLRHVVEVVEETN